MKSHKIKFIKRAMFFLFITLILLFLINAVYVNYILPEKNFYRKEIAYQNYISNHSEVKYAFFGDSHPFHAINPKFIPGAFNFGSGTQNYVKTYYLLDRVVNKDNIKVDNVVLQIDLHTFSSWLVEEPFLFNELELYSKFVPLEDIREIRKNSSIASLWIESNLPVIGKGKEFGIIFSPLNLSEMYEGWIKNPKDFSQINETIRKERAYEDYKVHFQAKERIDNLSLEYFLKTLKLAKENNINVILIEYPMSKEYKDMAEEYNLSDMDYYPKIFNATESILGQNYYLLEYQDLFLENPEYLGDTYHVNYKGAEILSKKIYQDLIALNLSNKESINTIKLSHSNKKNYFLGIFLFLIFLTTFLIEVFLLILFFKRRKQQ